MRTKRIGLIANPVAGMGGRVGLKGTDGDMARRAVELGAVPVSPERLRAFLDALACREDVHWLTVSGDMGARWMAQADLDSDVVYEAEVPTGPADTRRAALAMRDAGAELIVFAGGDGTARDMLDAIGQSLPVIAIPSGVKIYSSVFAYSPQAAAALLDAFVEGTELGEEEVLDIDEAAFREGRVDARHYGYLLVPEVEQFLQAGKQASSVSEPTIEARRALAAAVADSLAPGTLYLLGSGTTVRAVADQLGLEKTLLGIDAVLDGRMVGRDLNEQAILELLDKHANAALIVTPLGGNGFLFGRGNKQLSPAVLRRIPRASIVVVAGRDKLVGIPSLRVDTGDPDVDASLRGYIDVIVGRDYRKLLRVD